MIQQENQLKDIIATALIKAWEDDAFKEQLLAEPISTIEKLTGERLCFTYQMKNSEKSCVKADAYELDVPSYVRFDDTELNDDQLDFAAGGIAAQYRTLEDFQSFLKSYL